MWSICICSIKKITHDLLINTDIKSMAMMAISAQIVVQKVNIFILFSYLIV
jgi:hypothetical protein